ncbi:MAG: 4-hydroxy-3-methylbut-2-enyl diphosphate reductase [Candidatus Omnitrophica bacterium]|nr:4-hydroxy-3-methylbut-2-enyl diphosphate reductase [Candidatus Omnitrophota bacterium]
MKINLARSAGFCFGVKRALKLAYQTAKARPSVVMLGDIVHNEEVVKDITAAGIKKIDRLGKGKKTTLLIRAHGASKKTIERAHTQGYAIVDATCPMVKEIHTLAHTAERQGYTVIIIGDKKHDEVQGIIGQLQSNALVIDYLKNIPTRKLTSLTKAAVVVQSTQNMEKVLEIVDKIKKYVPDLKFFNTICNPTRIKQKEILTLPLENDVILVIGSKMSANTRRLYELARGLNRRTYWIQSKKELRKRWFKNTRSVGITAGASTPDKITNEIVAYLKTFTL